jgi:hypothetical protein
MPCQTDTFEPFLRDPAVQQKQLTQWDETGTGPLVNTISSHLGFFRIRKSNPVLSKGGDPTPGPNTPHYEFLVSVRLLKFAALNYTDAFPL